MAVNEIQVALEVALEVAVNAQPAPVVTLPVRNPPAVSNDWLIAERV